MRTRQRLAVIEKKIASRKGETQSLRFGPAFLAAWEQGLVLTRGGERVDFKRWLDDHPELPLAPLEEAFAENA